MKKTTLIKIAGIAAGLALIAPVVFADNDNRDNSDIKNQMQVRIERSGRAQLVGTLVSVSSTTLTVTSWGGNWSVDASNAKLVRRYGGQSNLSEFQAGDYLQIQGTASSSAAWTIIATIVKDNSIQVKNVNVMGTISNLNASSTPGFTLTAQNGQVIQVNVTSATRIYVNGQQGALSNLSNGISVRVKGVLDRNSKNILADRIEYKQQRISVNGTIAGLNSSNSSFALSADDDTFRVTLASGAKIRVNNGPAAFSDLQNGMKARVRGFGDKSLMTITADEINARTSTSTNR